ncbi:MAG: hypothetical protein AOA65_1516 [Candidatus Bathyarchaeota archaeon BA1]|nr:MAG: hypothetical protein AOA65_1516 [Candidatus Bathyarchaeota archaeon BA1]
MERYIKIPEEVLDAYRRLRDQHHCAEPRDSSPKDTSPDILQVSNT